MCEALVVARTDFPFDDGVAGGGRWRFAIGHVMRVEDDGYPWGALEDPRNFATAAQRRYVLILFPGVPKSRGTRWLNAQVDQITGALTTVSANNPSALRHRVWQLQWQSLPAAARNLFLSTGVVTIGPAGDFTWAQVQNFLTRLDTGAFDSDPLT